jgi:hypothetical protein
MLSSIRLGLLTAGVLVAAIAAPGAMNPVDAAPGASVSVRGRMLVVPAETPGDVTRYAVALPDGDIVPVRAVFSADVRTGARFDGRLAVPPQVLQRMTRRGESGSSAALRIVDHRSLTLRVVGTPSITAPAETASASGTVHAQYVAALANKGSLGQNDTQLLGHVADVGGYWAGQSNGAMSVTVPSAVTHYDTAVTPTSCGLGASQTDFFNLVQEAAAKFPGINPFGGTDQLVVFVPPSCFGGSTVGRGTVGASFASGGALIAESSTSIEGVYAHETGHNYGFQHANARLSGSSLEYYGIYDVMGFALPAQYNMLTALSTPYRVFQGITDAGEIQTVDLGNELSAVHATATLEPRSDTSGLRSVRVENPDTGEDLYLDYRAGTGQDASAAYAGGGSLMSGSTPIFYAPGVTINTARSSNGNDALVLDAFGNTSLSSGASWTSASGLLQITVTSIGAAGASVAVDFTPPQDFTTVGTPLIGGTVKVGGTISLATGTWVPTPTTTQIRWTADGQAQASLDDKTSFTTGASLVGKQLVATVTQQRSGYRTTTVQSGGVTVQPGTIHTGANPSVSGSAEVGHTLHATSGTWSAVLSPITATYRWRRNGVDIPGADGARYEVTPEDLGSTIRVVQLLVATGYDNATLTSKATSPVAPGTLQTSKPTIGGQPIVGKTLKARPGTWSPGTTFAYAWYADGRRIKHQSSAKLTLTHAQRGKRISVKVTGTKPGYALASKTSAKTAKVS